MPRLLKEIKISDVSSVDRGAGEGVKILLMKRDKHPEAKMDLLGEVQKKVAAGTLSRASVNACLDHVVSKLRRDGESHGTALSATISRSNPRYDETAAALMALSQEMFLTTGEGDNYLAKGAVDEASPGGKPKDGENGDGRDEAGTAYQKISEMAAAHRKEYLAKNPKSKMTHEMAFAHVMTRPENRELAVKANMHRVH